MLVYCRQEPRADLVNSKLGDVIVGRHPGRRGPEDFTLFKSLGLGAQDLVALEVAMEKAGASGIGTTVAW